MLGHFTTPSFTYIHGLDNFQEHPGAVVMEFGLFLSFVLKLVAERGMSRVLLRPLRKTCTSFDEATLDNKKGFETC